MSNDLKSALRLLTTALAAASASSANIKARFKKLSPVDMKARVEALKHVKSQAVQALSDSGVQSIEQFDQLKAQKIVHQEILRNFRRKHRIERPAYEPDIWKTVLMLSLGCLVDGGMTAGLVISEGKMDVIPAVSFGAVIAFIHALIGFLTGFYSLRYMGYRLNSKEPEPWDMAYRIAAWFGLILSVCATLFMLFAAIRARALGDYDGLFDFEALGFLESADSYFALALLILGLVSTLVAAQKGFSSDDPIPGYLKLQRATEDGPQEAGDDLFEEMEDEVEETFETASERISDMHEALRDDVHALEEMYAALTVSIAEHNSQIDCALQDINTAAEAQRRDEQYVRADNSIEARILDLNSLEALRIDPETLPLKPETNLKSLPDLDAFLAELESVQDGALASLRTAYRDFQNSPAQQFPIEI